MTLKYYRYDDPYSRIGGGVTYVEARDGVRALRQITVLGDQIHASNQLHPQFGPNLADIRVDYDSHEEIEPINKQAFDSIWNTHLAQWMSDWEELKRGYPIGTQIDGYIERFYPQGVIVQFGSVFWGLANYEECKLSTTPENMYSKQKIYATVSGYDEDYQWLLLKSPKVTSERVDL